MEASSIIEKTKSPFCSPMTVVRKKDGSVHICEDFRKVNAVTRTEAEPIFDQQGIFARISQSKLFSKMDLTKDFSRFPQIKRAD